MANIALIPARGGSKRIPGKNIRNFLGKPIIAYSIEAAKKSNCFDRIIVSTDCPEIKKVALAAGAEVPFDRPATISDDYATTNDVIKHAVNWLKNNNISIDLLCCIYATAPFIREKDIKLGLDYLEKNKDADFALSVTSFPFPIQRAIKINEGRIEMFSPEYLLTRSQDLEEAYHDAGQFYWGRPDAFLADVPFFSKASIPVILPRYLVQDIDNEEDWIRAERLYKANLQ
ncbi:MAG: pseudaminic acid cytidylyltransferase [Emcibacteraceae bacterium]